MEVENKKKSLKVKVDIGSLVTMAFELYTCCAIMLSLLNNLTTLNNSRLHQNNLLKRSNPCYFLSMLEHLY
uniref:Uncharacterized protein n=1 Tax=Glossina palpalis gambiensis TaxID=67801 RepID=A0A1B0BYW7_9MUSC